MPKFKKHNIEATGEVVMPKDDTILDDFYRGEYHFIFVECASCGREFSITQERDEDYVSCTKCGEEISLRRKGIRGAKTWFEQNTSEEFSWDDVIRQSLENQMQRASHPIYTTTAEPTTTVSTASTELFLDEANDGSNDTVSQILEGQLTSSDLVASNERDFKTIQKLERAEEARMNKAEEKFTEAINRINEANRKVLEMWNGKFDKHE